MAPAVPQIAELHALPSWRTVDFISDLHLQAAEQATFASWQRYMKSTTADALFILGDLFDVWVGDDAVGSRTVGSNGLPFEDQCAQVLSQTALRLPVFFMHGNRDFLVGQPVATESLLKRCRVTLLADPTVLVFPGQSNQRWLLSHGDLLCLADVDYLQFRQLVRSSEWQESFLARPLPERLAIACGLRQQSQQQHEARKQSGVEAADVDSRAVRQWLAAAQAGTLIHGHTHHPAEHDLGQGLFRVVLSDWDAVAPVPRVEVLRLSAEGLQRISLLCTNSS